MVLWLRWHHQLDGEEVCVAC
eukprot:SAG31_NODE_35513_length_322_cov_0.901345_1_plen_20_part_10